MPTRYLYDAQGTPASRGERGHGRRGAGAILSTDFADSKHFQEYESQQWRW